MEGEELVKKVGEGTQTPLGGMGMDESVIVVIGGGLVICDWGVIVDVGMDLEDAWEVEVLDGRCKKKDVAGKREVERGRPQVKSSCRCRTKSSCHELEK